MVVVVICSRYDEAVWESKRTDGSLMKGSSSSSLAAEAQAGPQLQSTAAKTYPRMVFCGFVLGGFGVQAGS